MIEPPAIPTTEPRRISPKAVAAVVGAVLGGIILAVVLLNLPRGETGDASGSASPTESVAASPSATATAEQSASPTATPQPTPTPRPEGAAPMDWVSGTPPDGEVFDIVWAADRWLAAGSVVEGENRPRAATWTSADGVAWEPGATIGPDSVPGPEGMSYFLNDVLVLADELIAFGWNHIGCCDGGKAAMWRSADGVTWTFVDTAGTDYGDVYHSPVESAVAPSGELVLVSAIGLGQGSTIFTSSDGVTWVEQPVEWEGVLMSSVAASDTILVAVGQDAFSTEPSWAIWTSADGHTWSVADAPPGSNQLNDVAWDAVSERFVVVGNNADGQPTTWLTENGTSWSTTTLATDDGYVASVGAADGLIVAGGLIRTAPDDELIAWSSFDGVTWQVEPLATSAGPPIVEVAGKRAVLHVSTPGPAPDYESIGRVWAGTVAR